MSDNMVLVSVMNVTYGSSGVNRMIKLLLTPSLHTIQDDCGHGEAQIISIKIR